MSKVQKLLEKRQSTKNKAFNIQPIEKQEPTKYDAQFRDIRIENMRTGSKTLELSLEDDMGMWDGEVDKEGVVTIEYLDKSNNHLKTYFKGMIPEATKLAKQAGFLLK